MKAATPAEQVEALLPLVEDAAGLLDTLQPNETRKKHLLGRILVLEARAESLVQLGVNEGKWTPEMADAAFAVALGDVIEQTNERLRQVDPARTGGPAR